MEVNGCDIQIEDGQFARLHNRILEVLATARLTASEFRAIVFLLRKTYGWNKKEDDLSLKQWSEGTDMDKTQVARTIADLIKKNVIYRTDSPKTFCHRYGFNKYVENWDGSIFGRIESRKTKNLDHRVKKNVDPGVKESEEIFTQGSINSTVENVNIDPVVKKDEEILTIGSNNKRHSTKDNSIRAATHRKEKPKSEERGDTEQQEWFSAICWLVHGHKDYSLLSNNKKSAIGKTVKEIRSSTNNYTLDDLRTWYRDIWSREWPGKQHDKPGIQPPTFTQIKEGIGRTRSSEQDGFAVSVTVPQSSILDFAVEDLTP